MRIFLTSADEPENRRVFTKVTKAENELLLGDEAANLLTCVEDRALFHEIRDSVHEEFVPRTRFQRIMADTIAEELWRKSRYSMVESTAVSAAIERDWEAVNKECVNPDPAYRTFVAYRDLNTREVACIRSGQNFESRAWRRSRTDMAALNALQKKKY